MFGKRIGVDLGTANVLVSVSPRPYYALRPAPARAAAEARHWCPHPERAVNQVWPQAEFPAALPAGAEALATLARRAPVDVGSPDG